MNGLPVGCKSIVLHGSGAEVGDGDDVELGELVLDVEVLFEGREKPLADLLDVVGVVNGVLPTPHSHPLVVLLVDLHLGHRESHQVRWHRLALPELHPYLVSN